eukprot:scaffold4626_cov183-Cylindrotheca_fusiformis.AAC.1
MIHDRQSTLELYTWSGLGQSRWLLVQQQECRLLFKSNSSSSNEEICHVPLRKPIGLSLTIWRKTAIGNVNKRDSFGMWQGSMGQ